MQQKSGKRETKPLERVLSKTNGISTNLIRGFIRIMFASQAVRVFLITLIALSVNFGQGQSEKQRKFRLESDKPTIYIEPFCLGKEDLVLRMVNNTSWNIHVESRTQFPTKFPIRLLNGVDTFAMPPDFYLASLVYRVEFDELRPVDGLLIPESARLGIGITNGGGWITSGNAIRFRSPLEYLNEGLKVVVPYSYEWEFRRGGYKTKEPDHRASFVALRVLSTLPRCEK